MATVARARHGGHDQKPAPTRAQRKARALGLTSATGLVVGSIVGTGVFAMPAVLAGAGTSSLLVLAVIALGAMLLAMTGRPAAIGRLADAQALLSGQAGTLISMPDCARGSSHG
jgi:hypothetical protein